MNILHIDVIIKEYEHKLSQFIIIFDKEKSKFNNQMVEQKKHHIDNTININNYINQTFENFDPIKYLIKNNNVEIYAEYLLEIDKKIEESSIKICINTNFHLNKFAKILQSIILCNVIINCIYKINNTTSNIIAKLSDDINFLINIELLLHFIKMTVVQLTEIHIDIFLINNIVIDIEQKYYLIKKTTIDLLDEHVIMYPFIKPSITTIENMVLKFIEEDEPKYTKR